MMIIKIIAYAGFWGILLGLYATVSYWAGKLGDYIDKHG